MPFQIIFPWSMCFPHDTLHASMFPEFPQSVKKLECQWEVSNNCSCADLKYIWWCSNIFMMIADLESISAHHQAVLSLTFCSPARALICASSSSPRAESKRPFNETYVLREAVLSSLPTVLCITGLCGVYMWNTMPNPSINRKRQPPFRFMCHSVMLMLVKCCPSVSGDATGCPLRAVLRVLGRRRACHCKRVPIAPLSRSDWWSLMNFVSV